MSGVQAFDSLARVPASEWDALTGGHPLLCHAFLHALHESGSACAGTGWAPCYQGLWRNGVLQAAMPLYLKSHSYGEYVFDWAWADAYQRHGLAYYPKLLSSVPFTPVTGPRLLARAPADREVLARAALSFARDAGVSSLHCLFPTETEARSLEAAGMMLRSTVQFHWKNEGYADFDEFLARMNHEKRKKIRQERRRLREAGLEFQRVPGAQASPAQWRFFVECYNRTYREHHSTPYLNLEFFERLAATMPDNLVLVIASRDGRPVASAFNVFGAQALYGRYWGTREFHSGLHFEVCYYQAIEFCIERGIPAFEGGAQGEHKLARGLLPVQTRSAHWLARPEFSEAVAQFLGRERRGIEHYVDELSEHSPFKDGNPADKSPRGTLDTLAPKRRDKPAAEER
ncbi:MAG TPA: GNAT family N-acetyltransferase [Burkholderiales bacterium]|jgi:predicted N-acyltransferase|nr:GNAT family N-acetyltransferase [Burkholderiales bacterium]